MIVLNAVKRILKNTDWLLFGATLFIMLAGLLTMNSYVAENFYFYRQMVWIGVGILVFFIASGIDFRFLRRTQVISWIFILSLLSLATLFILGTVSKGAQSWFNFGLFSFQPAEFAKLVLVIILAKYFSRRHIAIRQVRHVIISGMYAGLLFILVLLQPDFGSAIIIFLIWFGLVMVSGISKKHLAAVFGGGGIALIFLWFFVFASYQKSRILSFLNPLGDIQGTGYNAYQSTVAVGSGEIFGKGVGFGTQSRLKFLPEYETDFIFAAFAEEWGFIGVLILFTLFAVVIWRILYNAFHGATNFEILFGIGIAIIIMAHFTINVGMNIGLLPVTGITLPFMSYGGSHIVITFLGLGMLMGMRKYARIAHKDSMRNEFVGY